MLNAKYGDVVYVKSTEEPVTVIGTRPIKDDERSKYPDYPEVQTVVTVRRPVMKESTGISYAFFEFLDVELESGSDQTNRLFAKMKERQELIQDEMLGGEPIAAVKQLKPH